MFCSVSVSLGKGEISVKRILVFRVGAGICDRMCSVWLWIDISTVWFFKHNFEHELSMDFITPIINFSDIIVVKLLI